VNKTARVRFFLYALSMLSCFFPCHASDDTPEAPPGRGFNSEFVHTLGSTLEDGFFGGVKWGIAAAFYHVFYRAMAMAVGGVPSALQSLKKWYTHWIDWYTGRPPALNIHELQVLRSLLQESLQEYETLLVVRSEQHDCATACRRTLEAVIRHIDSYITTRMVRYTNLYTDQEQIFLMQLIATTIEGILGCMGSGEFHKEIIVSTKTTVILLQKLIDLLQGPVVDTDGYDPSMAWFSGQKRFLCV
jgi:hypothetical protein